MALCSQETSRHAEPRCGLVHCDAAKLTSKGVNLWLDSAMISGGVFIRDGFEAFGSLSMVGVQVNGALLCRGAKLQPTDGPSILASGATFRGGVQMSDGFEATGFIQMEGAQIECVLNCKGAKIHSFLFYLRAYSSTRGPPRRLRIPAEFSILRCYCGTAAMQRIETHPSRDPAKYAWTHVGQTSKS
jgi:hypothetical protein